MRKKFFILNSVLTILLIFFSVNSLSAQSNKVPQPTSTPTPNPFTTSFQPTPTPTINPFVTAPQSSITPDTDPFITASPTSLTPTNIFVTSPQVTNPPSGECSLKPKGDANCDNMITHQDYELWRQAFNKEIQHTQIADFNNDGNINKLDLNIWITNRF